MIQVGTAEENVIDDPHSSAMIAESIRSIDANAQTQTLKSSSAMTSHAFDITGSSDMAPTVRKIGKASWVIMPNIPLCESWIEKLVNSKYYARLHRAGISHPTPGLTVTGDNAIVMWHEKMTPLVDYKRHLLVATVSKLLQVSMRLGANDDSAGSPQSQGGSSGNNHGSNAGANGKGKDAQDQAGSEGKGKRKNDDEDQESSPQQQGEGTGPSPASQVTTFPLIDDNAIIKIDGNELRISHSFHAVDLNENELEPLPFLFQSSNLAVITSVYARQQTGKSVVFKNIHHSQRLVAMQLKQGEEAVYTCYVWDPSKESIVPNRASREVGLEAGGKAGLAAGKPAIKTAGKYASKRGYLCSSVPTQPLPPWEVQTTALSDSPTGAHLAVTMTSKRGDHDPLAMCRFDAAVGLGHPVKSEDRPAIDLISTTQLDLVKMTRGSPSMCFVLVHSSESSDVLNCTESPVPTRISVDLSGSSINITSTRRPRGALTIGIFASVMSGIKRSLSSEVSLTDMDRFRRSAGRPYRRRAKQTCGRGQALTAAQPVEVEMETNKTLAASVSSNLVRQHKLVQRGFASVLRVENEDVVKVKFREE